MTTNGLNYLLNVCYGGHRPTNLPLPVSVALRDSIGPAPR